MVGYPEAAERHPDFVSKVVIKTSSNACGYSICVSKFFFISRSAKVAECDIMVNNAISGSSCLKMSLSIRSKDTRTSAYAKAIEMNRGNRVQERYEATVDWIWL